MFPFVDESAITSEIPKYSIPDELKDSLIGPQIEGTKYYMTYPNDPTEAGFFLVPNAHGQVSRIYRTEHQPTGLAIRYRKIVTEKYGEVWEVIPED